MADNRFNDRAGASAGCRRSPEKGGGWTSAVVNIMDELKFCCADA
jgi:hypothetical protein